MALPRLDAAKTAQTRATDKVQQHRFDIVLAMMTHTHGIQPALLPQVLESSIAQLPGSHFDADMMFLGISFRIEMPYVQPNAQTLTKF